MATTTQHPFPQHSIHGPFGPEDVWSFIASLDDAVATELRIVATWIRPRCQCTAGCRGLPYPLEPVAAVGLHVRLAQAGPDPALRGARSQRHLRPKDLRVLAGEALLLGGLRDLSAGGVSRRRRKRTLLQLLPAIPEPIIPQTPRGGDPSASGDGLPPVVRQPALGGRRRPRIAKTGVCFLMDGPQCPSSTDKSMGADGRCSWQNPKLWESNVSSAASDVAQIWIHPSGEWRDLQREE